MRFRFRNSEDAEGIELTAAEWVLRCDRGLSGEEQDELSRWLAADRRHGVALALQRWSWEELDRLAGVQTSLAVFDPELVGPIPEGTYPRTGSRRAWIAGIAAALTLSVGVLYFARSPEVRSPVPTRLAAPCERRTLDDGTLVDCNRDAQIEVNYSNAVRQVRLVRGEVNFHVAKDPTRPFVVMAGDVSLHALGTVFNVRLDSHVVEVVVREGEVQMGRMAPERLSASATLPRLSANQRVVIPHTPAVQPLVTLLNTHELESRLAWQPRLLDFSDAPLDQIAVAFNRHNVVRVTLKDRSLHAVRLSATFRSDNVEGFLRLIESEFGVRADWRSESEVLLHKIN